MTTFRGLFNEKRADVHTACGYFTAHAGRMKYDEYLAADLPIATGVIEWACRHLVKDCLERTGMRWSASAAQAMLNLRSLRRRIVHNFLRKVRNVRIYPPFRSQDRPSQ